MKNHTLMFHERDRQIVYKDHLGVVFIKKAIAKYL
jgi:hypothetical protein